MKIFLIILSLLIISKSGLAREVSYSGGTTIMQKNNSIKNSIHLHYSPTYQYSVGYKGEYYRNERITLNGIQLNNLLKRWNLPAAQGNIYIKSGLGNAEQKNINKLYGFTSLATDFETRKYFISYQNSYYKSAGQIINQFEQSAMIGFAPYVANYGSLHSWLMLQISHIPKDSDSQIIATPLIRLFKSNHLIEFGISSNKKILFNFIMRF